MANTLLWLLTIEALGLAAFPLIACLFQQFPDRGYGVSKAAGLLLVGFANWWLGSILSLANYPILLWLAALLLLSLGGFMQREMRIAAPDERRRLIATIALEELIFLLAFVGWTLVRMQNPDIFATEKPMDFMLLQVSGATHSFPPPDAWLSGHTVNYYYLGYALFATLGRMAGVDPRFGFNYANITIFALGCVGAYSISLAMLKDRRWALAGPVALMLVGDLEGVAQLISEVQNGTLQSGGLNLFCSTRVIGGGCANYTTITEFPIFSLIWNDLHPHVMALPFALLAVGAALATLLDQPAETPVTSGVVRLLANAVIAGALYPINSWDFPTYLTLIVGAVLANAYRHHNLNWRSAAWGLALVPLSLLLYLPYYLTVHISGQGVGLRASPSEIGDVLTVIGPLLLPAAVFIVWRAAAALLAETAASSDGDSGWYQQLPRGWGYFTLGAVILFLAVVPGRTDLALLLLVFAAAYAFGQALPRDDAPLTFALGLALLASLLLLLGDYVYLRDIFDNSPQYRMNTVFKLYYQAWIVLAFVAVYGVARLCRAVWSIQRSATLLVAVPALLLTAAGLIYPIVGIPSQSPSQASGSLDGLRYLQSSDPTEYAALSWIRDNTANNAIIVEAVGTDAPSGSSCGEYWVCAAQQSYNKVSALTGRPTLIGWPGSHESLWRGIYSDPAAAALLHQREQDVRTIYTTTDPAVAARILHSYDAQYVYVGPVERSTYLDGMHLPSTVLSKFAAFCSVAYSNSDVTIYQVRR